MQENQTEDAREEKGRERVESRHRVKQNEHAVPRKGTKPHGKSVGKRYGLIYI